MNNYKKSSLGFTLIEILVTVAIAAILASIAIPSFNNLIESNRNTTGANELASNLMLAKSEALKRSNSVTLCPSENQQTCSDSKDYSTGWIIFLDCNSDGDFTPDDDTVCEPNINEEIIKVSEGFNNLFMKNRTDKKITFLFTGRLAGNSTFNIGKNSESIKRKVVINRVGRVRTQKVAP